MSRETRRCRMPNDVRRYYAVSGRLRDESCAVALVLAWDADNACAIARAEGRERRMPNDNSSGVPNAE